MKCLKKQQQQLLENRKLCRINFDNLSRATNQCNCSWVIIIYFIRYVLVLVVQVPRGNEEELLGQVFITACSLARCCQLFCLSFGLGEKFSWKQNRHKFLQRRCRHFPLIAANLIGISLPDAKQKQKASNKSQIGAWRSKRCRRWSVRRQIDIRGLPLLFMQMRLLTCIRHKVNV